MERLSYLLLLLFIASCNNAPKSTDSASSAKDFDTFKNTFVEKLWALYPGWASGVGYHNYDSVLVVPDAAYRQKQLEFADWIDTELKKFKFDGLATGDKTDYRMVQNFAEGVRFNVNRFKSYEWAPSNYNIGGDLFDVLDYKQRTIDENLRLISKKLTNVPAYFEAAKKNISNPTKEHTLLAIKQNKNSLEFFDKTFPDSLKSSKLSEQEQSEFNTNATAARKAVEDYVAWLEKDLLPKLNDSARNFRIGKELYAEKFKLDIESRYTAEEMYKIAEARKQYVHGEMDKLADQLWTKYFANVKAPENSREKIKKLIDKISVQHCKAEDFLPTIEKQLPELTAFINSHNIIDLDSTKPLKVRKTPGYAAGVAGAGINSPGPYDKDAVTYYNVTPLSSYSKEDAESYLREYNDYILQILNIHEAIPGHYTQLIYSNRSPSIIKSILGNGAMIEGWACYVERMMIEEGYNPSPEMQLFYYKWNLRETCNFLLDYNIHCNGWDEKQVMDLLVNEAFQQNAEAKEKYKRASLTQVQLTSYFTGLTEIYELREEIKKRQGDKFDLKKFHEQFLSYGSAPVKEIRALMLP